MKKRSLKVIFTMVVCMCMLCMNVLPAFAATDSQIQNDKVKQQQQYTENLAKYAEMHAAIDKLTKYVERQNNGTFVLNAPKNVTDKIDNDILSQLKSGMEGTNKLILNGTLKSKADLTVYDPSDNNYSIQANQNKVVQYWWGFSVYMDSRTTNLAIADLNRLGYVTTGVLACITGIGPVATFVYGATYYFYVDMFTTANAAGNGIIVDYMYVSYPYANYVITAVRSQ